MHGRSNGLLLHSGLFYCLLLILCILRSLHAWEGLIDAYFSFVLQSRYYRSPEVLLGYQYPCAQSEILLVILSLLFLLFPLIIFILVEIQLF